MKKLAFFTIVMLFFSIGCTYLPGNDEGINKDDQTIEHAFVKEKEEVVDTDTEGSVTVKEEEDNNEPEENDDIEIKNDQEKPGNDSEEIYDQDGFVINDPGSFASRAVGTYRIISDDEEIEEWVEFYNVNDNLYAIYYGYGYAAIEFFANDMEGFSSETSNSMEVKAVSFSSMSNFSRYWSEGMPAIFTMTLEDDRILFSGYQNGSGEFPFELNAELERVDRGPGLTEGFDYNQKDVKIEELLKTNDTDTETIPDDILGSWILLGDTEYGIVCEFTKEGKVQIYLKNLNEPVLLCRGEYAIGKEEINGGKNIYLDLMQLGYGSMPLHYNLCYVFENDSLKIVKGDETWGEDMVWENAVFIRFNNSDIPRKFHDEYSLAQNFSGRYGIFASDDNMEIVIDADGYYYIYNSADISDLSGYVEGSFKEDENGLILYQTNYEGGQEEEYGVLSYIDENTVSVVKKGETEGTIYKRKQNN